MKMLGLYICFLFVCLFFFLCFYQHCSTLLKQEQNPVVVFFIHLKCNLSVVDK